MARSRSSPCRTSAWSSTRPRISRWTSKGQPGVGDRVYWIGSHSANKEGKPRPNRRRLFATMVETKGSEVTVKVVGQPYKNLINDLDQDPDYAAFGLKEAGRRAPKESRRAEHRGPGRDPRGGLLIGFRNPVPDGKALIARLNNPKGVTEGKPPKFGAPIRLDLGGLGVRSLEWAESLKSYLIVGGLPGEGSGSRLFRWSGAPGPEARPDHWNRPRESQSRGTVCC